MKSFSYLQFLNFLDKYKTFSIGALCLIAGVFNSKSAGNMRPSYVFCAGCVHFCNAMALCMMKNTMVTALLFYAAAGHGYVLVTMATH
jgi:hypothetical protein